MKKIKDFLFNKWTLTILTIIAIAVLVYFVGPLFAFAGWAPLSSTTARWLTIITIVLIWQGIRFIRFIKAKNEENGFLDNLFAKKEISDTEQKVKDERGTLESKFKEAIEQLKKASKTLKINFNLYDIPWYIIIGPPGSGKTTALVNSGLKFPLAKEHGGGAIQGIGGTRNCDWWFTDKGIIIDTAGRYTTQDSHQEVDSAAWKDFLNLLKKFRKRRPINGVFVTISLQELMLQTTDQRARHVAAISTRLQELKDSFQVQFPVYVLVTKADLISGFEEYFDNLGVNEREQVWGITFPYGQDQSSEDCLNAFSDEFDQLIKTLNERLVNRLYQEKDQLRSVKVASFAKQLQSVKPLIGGFLSEVFEKSRYSQPLLLRGAYLCSGTQEGTPIDRLMNRLSTAPSIRGNNQGKSYFIKNLFENIVFKESGLVGSDIKFERKLRVFNGAAIVAVIGLTALLSVGWLVSYSNNEALVTQTESELSELQKLVDDLPASEHSAVRLLPILNAARQLPGGYDDAQTTPPWSLRLGLYQGEKLGDSTLTTYEQVLNKILLSRLIVDTEDQLTRDNIERSFKYAALRVYMMLGSESHYKAADVGSFYQLTWLQRQAEDLTSEEFAQFNAHIEALFDTRPVPLPVVLDQTLIANTQKSLLNAPLVETIYARLTQTDLSDIPGFNIYDSAGQQLASSVFIRKSGQSLADGLPPLFSKAAYSQIVDTEIPQLSDEVVQESWVYGDNYQQSSAIDKDSLVKGATELYQQHYIDAYKNLLADIDIYPYASYEGAAKVLHILSGQTNPSPLVALLEAVKKETDFSNAALASTISANTKFKQAKDNLKRLIGSSPDVASGSIPKDTHPVSAAFGELNRLLPENPDAVNAPINKVIEKISELNDFMGRIAATSRDGALDPALITTGEEVVQKIKQTAQTQPNLFVAPYLKSIASRTGSLTFGGAMVHINQLWVEEPYETCVAAVQDNFPFSPNARSEMPLSDFGTLFGYGGVLDSFFNEHLKEYVNTASSPWRVKPSHRKLISISNEALSAFENAHYIRRAFFAKGANKVETSFKLKPQELDDGLRGFFLRVDGQEINYEFGPLIADTLSWPGPNPGSGVSMHLRQVNGPNITISEEGDWAWFRLLRKMQMNRASSNTTFDLNFKAAGYSAHYELTADKSFSPYRLGSRIPFRCPKAL